MASSRPGTIRRRLRVGPIILRDRADAQHQHLRPSDCPNHPFVWTKPRAPTTMALLIAIRKIARQLRDRLAGIVFVTRGQSPAPTLPPSTRRRPIKPTQVDVFRQDVRGALLPCHLPRDCKSNMGSDWCGYRSQRLNVLPLRFHARPKRTRLGLEVRHRPI